MKNEIGFLPSEFRATRLHVFRAPGRWLGMVALLAVVALSVGFPNRVAAAGSVEKMHREAVQQARQGHYEKALDRLADLVRLYPGNASLRYDYLTVLSWAGRDVQVLEQLDAIDLRQAPRYVLEAAGKSARNLKRPELAVKLYRQAVKRFPDSRSVRLGLVLSLADAGETDAARAELRRLRGRFLSSSEWLETLAYIQECDGDHAGAIATYERLLRAVPTHRGARRGRVFNLLRLGAAHEAVRLARKERELFTEAEWDRLLGDQAAARIRWGRLPVRDPAERYRETDAAIEQLESHYRQIRDKGSMAALRNRFDLLLALRNRRRMEDVVALYEKMRKEGVDGFPPYVQAAVGDAYLTLRQPESALPLLESAVVGDPHDLDARYTRFYAYLESGRYRQALQDIDALVESLPRKEWLPDGKRWRWSYDWIYARTVAALARAYMGQLGEAEDRLRALAAEAPADPDVRSALGDVVLWRGHPRRARDEYRTVLTHEPQHLRARLGMARQFFVRGDAVATDAALAPLLEHWGDDVHVAELARDVKVRDMREVWAGVDTGSGTASYQGARDLRIDTYYYHNPFYPGLRPYLHLVHGEAEFSGELVRRDQLAAGLHYRGRDISLRGFIGGGDGPLVMGGRVERWFSDQWRLQAGVESNALDVPLQARHADIYAWSAWGGVTYRFHEGRRLDLNIQRLTFDDDNERNVITATVRERLFESPRYRLEGELVTHHQRNTRSNAPYYNPYRLTTVDVGLDNYWEGWRRYDYSMHHRLQLQLGRNAQYGYSSLATWGIRYAHHWQFGPRVRLDYGLGWNQPVYDGEREEMVRGFVNFYVRF